MFCLGMDIKFDFIKFNTGSNIQNKPQNISFKSTKTLKSDKFEKNTNIQNFDMCIYNPSDLIHCSGNVSVDLSKPQKIVLEGYKPSKRKHCIMELDYDPSRTGFIWDKQKNKPIKTVILKSVFPKDETAYHFMSENLKQEYGYIDLTLYKNPKAAYNEAFFDRELYLDYPQQQIKGPRVLVNFLQNWNDNKYGAIGKLADKISVKHCLDNGIKPVIVSIAETDSHAAHYLRGKRFFPLIPQTIEYDFFTRKYHCSDVNQILKKLIEEAEKSNEKVDLTGWGFLPMYMPQELAQKYIKELKSEKK